MTALAIGLHALDLILAAVAAEAAGLVLLYRRTGRGVAPAALLPNLAAGACLLLALRLGLAGAWIGWLALCLAGALAAHLIDLRQRWRPGPGHGRRS